MLSLLTKLSLVAVSFVQLIQAAVLASTPTAAPSVSIAARPVSTPSLVFNVPINARRLYVMPMMGWLASHGLPGRGLYACSGPGWSGQCNWRNVIGNGIWGNETAGTGVCARIIATQQSQQQQQQQAVTVAALGPDQGVYCAVFQNENTCRWYSGQDQRQNVPAQSETAMLMRYPGVSDLSGVGWPQTLNGGNWAYCFRTEAAFNPCTEVWGPSC